MNPTQLVDKNVKAFRPLITPRELTNNVPLHPEHAQGIANNRDVIRNILDKKDPRLLIVVGPCSIHDIPAAQDYAQRLRQLAHELQDSLYLVMRVYFEKPRTTVGWKGLLNDPQLNNTFNVAEGLHTGRKLLVHLAEMGLPVATEALDPIVPQYLQDLVSWSAIGARTTESQTHREMSSGLSTPLGFKNSTDGNLAVAYNAMTSAMHPHSFLGINTDGNVCQVETQGNQHVHIILRGGGGKTNYDSVNVGICERELQEQQLPVNIMIDTSHANSEKDPERQPLIIEDIGKQIAEGNKSIIGLMIESNLVGGNQKLDLDNLSSLRYGQSVTDGCIDWDTTAHSLRALATKVQPFLAERMTPSDQ